MRFLACFAVLAMASLGFCTPDILQAFVSTYAPKTNLAAMKCGICHTSPPERNLYGKAVQAAISPGKPVDAAVFHSIETKDADGDGFSNIEEIQADTAPGDPASKPAGAPKQAAEQAASGGLLPRHGFHPQLVHFPIALFLFGAALEFFGWRRKENGLRQAAWLCLLWGALSTLAAVATGLTAFFLQGLAFEGPVLTHFLLATGSTLLMLGTVAWRRKAAHESMAYFALLLVAVILVSVAGHFGGNLVYG
jgi:uncharacterized membrane protein